MQPRLISSCRINFSPHLPSLMNHAIGCFFMSIKKVFMMLIFSISVWQQGVFCGDAPVASQRWQVSIAECIDAVLPVYLGYAVVEERYLMSMKAELTTEKEKKITVFNHMIPLSVDVVKSLQKLNNSNNYLFIKDTISTEDDNESYYFQIQNVEQFKKNLEECKKDLSSKKFENLVPSTACRRKSDPDFSRSTKGIGVKVVKPKDNKSKNASNSNIDTGAGVGLSEKAKPNTMTFSILQEGKSPADFPVKTLSQENNVWKLASQVGNNTQHTIIDEDSLQQLKDVVTTTYPTGFDAPKTLLCKHTLTDSNTEKFALTITKDNYNDLFPTYQSVTFKKIDQNDVLRLGRGELVFENDQYCIKYKNGGKALQLNDKDIKELKKELLTKNGKDVNVEEECCVLCEKNDSSIDLTLAVSVPKEMYEKLISVQEPDKNQAGNSEEQVDQAKKTKASAWFDFSKYGKGAKIAGVAVSTVTLVGVFFVLLKKYCEYRNISWAYVLEALNLGFLK